MYLEVRSWLKKYGYAPDHPLTEQNEYTLRAVQGYIETVKRQVVHFAPYRHGVNPWKSSGIATHLKPDFKARRTDDDA